MECEGNPCENGGTCTRHVSDYNCTCSPGYSGDRCEVGEHGNTYTILCILPIYTSAKIIQWGCRDGMHRAKNRGNKIIPLAILSRILAQSCVTPLP